MTKPSGRDKPKQHFSDQPALSMGAKEWLMLVGLSLVWGGSFFFNELALVDYTPVTIVWLRVTIAAVCLWALLLFKGVSLPRSKKFWFSIVLMGLFNNALPFSLIVWGQQEISSGLASILNATMPLFTVIVAGLFLADERLALTKLLGVFIGLGGVVVIIGPSNIVTTNIETADTELAKFAVLGAAICYACASVFGRRFQAMNIPPLLTAASQVTLASVWLLPVFIMNDGPNEFVTFNMVSMLSVLSLGVVCTAFAYVCYFKILASSGATNISLVTFLVPVSAIFLGWLILGEQLQVTHYLGMLCIAVGLAAIDGRILSRLRAQIQN